MLWTIFLILLVLWLLGIAVPVGAGSLIHLLLVLAVIVLIFQIIPGIQWWNRPPGPPPPPV